MKALLFVIVMLVSTPLIGREAMGAVPPQAQRGRQLAMLIRAAIQDCKDANLRGRELAQCITTGIFSAFQ